jgi:phage terminase large subunit
MTTARIKLPAKLVPIFQSEADTRGAYGGRGSGKTRSFATMTAIRAHMWAAAGDEGIILCGRQFMNSLADSSFEEVRAAINAEAWLKPHFDIGDRYIRTACKRISYSFAGLDRNIDSIKGKARLRLAWIDEAENVTEEAWTKLIPTLREEDSELWVTWNPERAKSATNVRFRNDTDPRTRIAEINYQDNPFFPAILERKRLKDLAERPEQYGHIWDGEFKKIYEGAYFADALNVARKEGRIGRVAADPLMSFYAYWDLGISDHTTIWIAQLVGLELRVIDYIEATGQPLAYYVNELRSRGFGAAECVLPHDGARRDTIAAVKFEDHLREAGFPVRTVANQGKGAAMQRVEAVRRLFPRIWIDEGKCGAGIEALAAYHERKDEARGIGLGPEHDWASHGADAFGLMCIAYEEPRVGKTTWTFGNGGGSWMAA